MRAQRVSVISFSHGAAVGAGLARAPYDEPAFALAVAYYSNCDTRDLSSTPVGAGRWRAAAT